MGRWHGALDLVQLLHGLTQVLLQRHDARLARLVLLVRRLDLPRAFGDPRAGRFGLLLPPFGEGCQLLVLPGDVLALSGDDLFLHRQRELLLLKLPILGLDHGPERLVLLVLLGELDLFESDDVVLVGDWSA